MKVEIKGDSIGVGLGTLVPGDVFLDMDGVLFIKTDEAAQDEAAQDEDDEWTVVDLASGVIRSKPEDERVIKVDARIVRAEPPERPGPGAACVVVPNGR